MNNVSEEVVRVHPLGLQSDPVVYVRVQHAETGFSEVVWGGAGWLTF